MKLSRIEKNILKLLLENSRITDIDIGIRLRITSQAVCKIKMKLLHRKVIKNYTTEINYSYLGITVFAIAMIKILPGGRNEDFIKKLICSNVIGLFNIINSKSTHILKCGFNSIEDLWLFFDEINSVSSEFIVFNKIYTFPFEGFIKNSPKDFFDLLVEQSGDEVLCINCSKIKYSIIDKESHCEISLNQNELEVLKLLVNDSSMPCSKIADLIPCGSLTHSGVNKIKKKLEINGVVSRYTVDLDYCLFGVGLFAFIFLKKKNKYWKLEGNLCEWALNNSNVIGCYKVNETSLHILQCGFRNLDELYIFISFLEIENESLFEVENVYILSPSGLVLDSLSNLF